MNLATALLTIAVAIPAGLRVYFPHAADIELGVLALTLALNLLGTVHCSALITRALQKRWTWVVLLVAWSLVFTLCTCGAAGPVALHWEATRRLRKMGIRPSWTGFFRSDAKERIARLRSVANMPGPPETEE